VEHRVQHEAGQYQGSTSMDLTSSGPSLIASRSLRVVTDAALSGS
jgi:hypothetical protein